MKKSVAEIVVDYLCDNGIKKVFCVPGVNILPILEEIEKRDGIENVVCKTEGGAAYMADGYAKLNGIGCCIATTGPGISNTITGVATSYYDSVPVMFISAQVSNKELGKYGIQEMSGAGRTPNVLGMMKNVTKYATSVRDKDEVKNELERVFAIMKSDRKGPCYLEICENILNEIYETSDNVREKRPFELTGSAGDSINYQEMLDIIDQSISPVLLIGNGVRDADALTLEKLLTKLNIKCVATLLAKDILPTSTKNYFGVIGCYGNLQANKMLSAADTVIVLGSTLGYLSTSGWSLGMETKKVIRVDIDAAELNRNADPIKSFHCDAVSWLEGFVRYLEKNGYVSDYIERDNLTGVEQDQPVKKGGVCNPISAIDIINRYKNKNDIIVSDVGQNAYWLERYITIEKGTRFITNGGMGAMGYGVASSIGASAAVRSQKDTADVICVCGDGGLLMTGTEISTAVSNNLKVIWIVFNNNALGTQNAWARKVDYSIRFDIEHIDYVQFAVSLGADGMKANNEEEFMRAFSYAKSIEKPILIEVQIDYLSCPQSYYGENVGHVNR